MTLQKGFLQRKLLFSEIPVTRKYIGPFMGVLVAIAFYTLLYFSRDLLRELAAYNPEDFWELSSEDLNFYNFFYAAISSLLGQSVCFNIWFHRSRQTFSPPRLLSIRILNDQNVLIWYFLTWFGKLAFVYWIFFGMTFWGGHYVFSFYPDYNYMFYLVLAVLFLQSWTNFRLLFAKQSLWWVIASAFILGLFSLTLSRVNFIDQNAFQQRKLESSIYNKYNFELPRSDYYKLTDGYMASKLQLVVDSSATSLNHIILLNNHQISLNKLKEEIHVIFGNIPDYNRSRAAIHLYIDRRVSIAFVENVKAEIARTGFRKIYYMVTPLNPQYDVRYYSNYGIEGRVHLSHYFPDSVKYDTIIAAPHWFYQLPTISPNKIRVNSSKLNQDELQEMLKERIREEPNKIIRYNYNPKDPFSKYLKVLTATHQAVEALREELFVRMADTMKEYTEYDLRNEINNQIPFGFRAIPKEK